MFSNLYENMINKNLKSISEYKIYFKRLVQCFSKNENNTNKTLKCYAKFFIFSLKGNDFENISIRIVFSSLKNEARALQLFQERYSCSSKSLFTMTHFKMKVL